MLFLRPVKDQSGGWLEHDLIESQSHFIVNYYVRRDTSEADLSLNLPVLLFTLAATTLAGILFGCAPAWYASRIDPGEALKEGGRAGTGSAAVIACAACSSWESLRWRSPC